MIGLLPPSTGQVLVNGIDIYEPANFQYLLLWRNKISHAPQNIYLRNTTLVNNILGEENDSVHHEKLVQAFELASLMDFIDYSDIYDYKILDNGENLSGGQRKRIGIAKALYHNDDFLYLDEPTSALDNETSDKVMN